MNETPAALSGPRRPAPPWRYGRGILASVARIVVIVMLGIVAIYLSDRIITHFLFDALEFGAGGGFILRVMVFAVPDLLYIAFPMALLIGVYLTLLRKREESELAVFASAGVSPRMLIVLALAAGLTGQVLSLLLAGFIEPHARHLLQRNLAEVRTTALTTGRLPQQRTFEVGTLTLHTRSIDPVSRDLQVMVIDSSPGAGLRTLTAGSVRVRVAQPGEPLNLQLGHAELLYFSPAPGEGPYGSVTEPRIRVRVATLGHVFDGAVLSSFAPRGAEPATLTLTEILFSAAPGPEGVTEATARIWRASLCLLAPLLGLVAMALTDRRSVYVALPLASGVALGASTLGGHALSALAGMGLWVAVGAALGLASVLLAGLVFWAARLENRCIRPERVNL
jgi:lipopolysaccharide export system permease protein